MSRTLTPPPGCLCARCGTSLRHDLARRTEHGWMHRWHTTCEARERLEDLRWMAETGESVLGAAKRLGISRESLTTWCRRNDAMDIYDALRRRNPTAIEGTDWGIPDYLPRITYADSRGRSRRRQKAYTGAARQEAS